MRVTELRYKLKPILKNQTLEAKENSPSFGLGGFDCVVRGNQLHAIPTEDFASVDAARAAIHPLLGDWEVQWMVESIPLQFVFAGADASGEATDGSGIRALVATDSVGLRDEAFCHVSARVEGPSGEFRRTAIGQLIIERWLSPLRPFNEPAPAAAYSLLTFIQWHYGGRSQALVALNVSSRVWKRANALAGQADPKQGRKFKGPWTPLSNEEVNWLNAFVRAAGKRAILVESGTPIAETLNLDSVLPSP